MKKYFVSIALKVPANFEIEIVAKNKKDALIKALQKYDDGNFEAGGISDPLWEFQELDARNASSEIITRSPRVHIEKI